MEGLSPEQPPTPVVKKKKKDKKRKDKERNRRSLSGTPPLANDSNREGSFGTKNLHRHQQKATDLLISISESPASKNADEIALSEAELESRRAALLAQLNMQDE